MISKSTALKTLQRRFNVKAEDVEELLQMFEEGVFAFECSSEVLIGKGPNWDRYEHDDKYHAVIALCGKEKE